MEDVSTKENLSLFIKACRGITQYTDYGKTAKYYNP